MPIAMPTVLNGKQRRYLRALAHAKKPVVQLGKEGLTPAVASAIDQSLETHELIKVKVGSNGADDVAELALRIEKSTRSHLCDVIGRTLLLYRRRAKEPTIVLPRAGAKAENPGAKAEKSGAKAKKPSKARSAKATEGDG